MKILHINSYYSVSSFYKNLYDKQKESGLNLDVYVPVSTAVDVSDLKLGDYTTISKNHGKYDRLAFHIKHKKIYNDIVKKYEMNDFSIVHAHSLFSNGYIALRVKKDFGIPYVVAVRNTDANAFFKYMIHLRKLGVKILKEAEKVIFLSKTYRDFVVEKYVFAELKKEILNKTEIITNGIDDFWFQNKGAMKACPRKENLRLVYAGIINKNKNLITIAKAIEILQQKGYNVQFTVVGRIANKRIYQQITVRPYVKYVEPRPKEELIKIYRANDIFVMPSIHETFGLVYAEAMSQGLPVIYTKGQGFDEQFEEGMVGYHVDCFNAEEIANRIIDMSNNYEVLSKNCTKLCSKFDWQIISKNYRKLYGDVCCEK
jgi:glycosyltransferase involved in cell wall biosynthesis